MKIVKMMMLLFSFFLYKLEHFSLEINHTNYLLLINYLRGRLVTAKYVTFNRAIRSSFEIYRQQFYKFANLAYDFHKIIFAKTQLAFELFLQNTDSYEVRN